MGEAAVCSRRRRSNAPSDSADFEERRKDRLGGPGMISKSIFCVLCFSLLAEAAGAEELNGVLGESVTFQVKTSPPLRSILWMKQLDNDSPVIALQSLEESCHLLKSLPAIHKRVKLSKDCREFQLNHLEQEDAGRYISLIYLPSKMTEMQFFDLRVSQRLVDSQLTVTCVPGAGGGNGTWQLNCSMGTWEDGVNFSWTSAAQREGPTRGNSLISLTSRDLHLNATCTAENLVSQASRTVSLKEVCADPSPPVTGLILGLIVAGLVTVAVVAYVLKKRAGRRSRLGFAKGSEIEDPAKSDSSLKGGKPKESRGKKAQPPRKAAKNSQEMTHTIYTMVQHPKQDPSQTDDEKMRRKKQRSISNQGEKTIYSEISKSQESDDQAIKTIYETVKNPPPAKPSDFRAFV